jgi:DNA helicase IV
MTAPYLATLNPEQRHAVEHSGDQPLLIIAGAGSGKTNTLAHRVAHAVPIDRLGCGSGRVILWAPKGSVWKSPHENRNRDYR